MDKDLKEFIKKIKPIPHDPRIDIYKRIKDEEWKKLMTKFNKPYYIKR